MEEEASEREVSSPTRFVSEVFISKVNDSEKKVNGIRLELLIKKPIKTI